MRVSEEVYRAHIQPVRAERTRQYIIRKVLFTVNLKRNFLVFEIEKIQCLRH